MDTNEGELLPRVAKTDLKGERRVDCDKVALSAVRVSKLVLERVLASHPGRVLAQQRRVPGGEAAERTPSFRVHEAVQALTSLPLRSPSFSLQPSPRTTLQG